MKDKEEQDRLDKEFRREMSGIKLEFGNHHHIRIGEKITAIARLEKQKQTAKVIGNINRLKQVVIWLIKMDF